VRSALAIILAAALGGGMGPGVAVAAGPEEGSMSSTGHDTIAVALPAPSTHGRVSLEEALASRRSIREVDPRPLNSAQLSQLLWATQGITDAAGLRAAPSAGALYPLEVYVAAADGLLRYEPRGHRLLRVDARDLRGALARAALGQECVARAPAVFVIAAVTARTERKYGTRAGRYVDMEAGHAAQNLLLQATALGLGGVPVGAFDDEGVRSALGLPREQRPLYLVPVGKRRT
jgi:SagB-type dehydrogenase family enzyme